VISVEAALRRINALEQRLADVMLERSRLRTEVRRLTNENTRLRTALARYADEMNWERDAAQKTAELLRGERDEARAKAAALDWLEEHKVRVYRAGWGEALAVVGTDTLLEAIMWAKEGK